MAAVAAGCPLLRRLDLSGCRRITDASAAALGSACHELRFLSLRQCHSLGPAGFAVLAAGVPHLESLDLSDCSVTGVSVTAFAAGCPLLRHLSLNRACPGGRCGDGIDGASVVSLAGRCSQLRSIHLGQCLQMDDSVITALLAGSPRLAAIGLRYNGYVTQAAVDAATERGVAVVGW